MAFKDAGKNLRIHAANRERQLDEHKRIPYLQSTIITSSPKIIKKPGYLSGFSICKKQNAENLNGFDIYNWLVTIIIPYFSSLLIGIQHFASAA